MNIASSWRAVAGLGLATLGAMGSSCSFAYTKGPQPEVQPPPACTTSNEAAVTDTVLGAASVGAIVGGSIIAHNTGNCGSPWCGLSNGLTGDGIVILGAISTLIFVPSAITGYTRTSACRRWLEENPQLLPNPPPRARQPERSSSALELAPPCSSRGDAPLLCSSGMGGRDNVTISNPGLGTCIGGHP